MATTGTTTGTKLEPASGSSATRRKPVGKDVSTRRRLSRGRRHFRIRKKLRGTPARPRLVVNRSSRHMFVQLVDDTVGKTVASASTMEPDVRTMDGDKTARATKVGELVGTRAKQAGYAKAVFDRGGHTYHGRVAALADAAREAGLEF